MNVQQANRWFLLDTSPGADYRGASRREKGEVSYIGPLRVVVLNFALEGHRSHEILVGQLDKRTTPRSNQRFSRASLTKSSYFLDIAASPPFPPQKKVCGHPPYPGLGKSLELESSLYPFSIGCQSPPAARSRGDLPKSFFKRLAVSPGRKSRPWHARLHS